MHPHTSSKGTDGRQHTPQPNRPRKLCILSVSWDESLLRTRELILKEEGHKVVSALGLAAGLQQCQTGPPFDMLLLGHSLTPLEKEALIAAFRAGCTAPVVALSRGPEYVSNADFEIAPTPEELVRVAREVAAGTASGTMQAFGSSA